MTAVNDKSVLQTVVAQSLPLEGKVSAKLTDEVLNLYGTSQHDLIVIYAGGQSRPPLRGIVGWFKTMTTNEYIANVKNNIYPSFEEKLWQRNYYEHVIRNENDYLQSADYILQNPLKWVLENK